jgi:hypothetical protein
MTEFAGNLMFPCFAILKIFLLLTMSRLPLYSGENSGPRSRERYWAPYGDPDMTKNMDDSRDSSATCGSNKLREQASRCRRLARDAGDARTAQVLIQLAEDYDRKAAAVEAHPSQH